MHLHSRPTYFTGQRFSKAKSSPSHPSSSKSHDQQVQEGLKTLDQIETHIHTLKPQPEAPLPPILTQLQLLQLETDLNKFSPRAKL